MAKLTPAELESRLCLDYRVAMKLTGPVISVQAFRTVDDLHARRNPITDADDASIAWHYLVRYNFPTLAGPDSLVEQTEIHFDLQANGNYPYTEPASWVLTRPMPWSPHFKEGHPVCVGPIWQETDGKLLLAHLITHLAHVLNYHEPVREGYAGWNGEAVAVWRDKYHYQPITPGLAIPEPDATLTHGAIPRNTSFAGRRQASPQRREGQFQPTPRTASSAFMPARGAGLLRRVRGG